MPSFTHKLSRFAILAFAGLSSAALLLSGCNMATSAPAVTTVSDPISLPAMKGTVMGGETPVASSLVTLWETDPANTGYGKAATVLAGPVTSSSPGGAFAFSSVTACTPGTFIYVTSTGGDVANGSTPAIINQNLVLVAALGSCASFSSHSSTMSIIINELSTVAAAYALSGFSSVAAATSGSTTFSNNQQVYIGAPAANNAATGSCTGTGTAMSCTAAGLGHAFANALNLVDDNNYITSTSSGSGPTGQAFTTVPNNPNGSVPTAVINTLGNIMQFCTNSPGGMAGDGSNCGLFFTAATPTAGVPPTDTFTAMMNVAHYPDHNIGTTCSGTPATTGGLYCLASSYPSFVPSLANAPGTTGGPHDWSLAIAYTAITVADTISQYSINGGVATFTTRLPVAAGETVTLSGFPTSTFLNGQSVTALAANSSASPPVVNTATQFEANVTGYTASITGYSIASNVVTFTAANAFFAGESVVISNFTGANAFLNGTLTVSSASATQFTASFTYANTATTSASGTATISTTAVNESGTATIPGTFGTPQYLTLDANDNVYIQTGNLNTATQTGQAAMSSAGTGLWYNPITANQCAQGTMATDTNGNVFVSVYASSTGTCTWGIYSYNTSTGVLTNQFAPGSGTVCNQASPTSANCPGFPSTGYDTVHPIQSTLTGITIDRLSNLWYSRRSTSCANCLLELPFNGSSYGAATTVEGYSAADWDAAYQLVVDATGNVYSSSLIANLFVTPNTFPSSPNTPVYVSSTSSNVGYITQAAGGTTFGMAALDSAGNLWTGYADTFVELQPVTSSITAGELIGFTSVSITNTASKPEVSQFDGHDTLFSPSYSTSGDIYAQVSPSYSGYNAAAQNAYDIQPCYTPANSSTCSTTLSTSDPHDLQIDSTGSIWIMSEGSSTGAQGFITQLIGTAYPTWPQLSYAKFGVEPQ